MHLLSRVSAPPIRKTTAITTLESNRCGNVSVVPRFAQIPCTQQAETIMTKQIRCMAAFLSLLVAAATAEAGLKEIHVDKLPQDESVQKAYAEAMDAEQYASAWSGTWKYDVPKDKVASALKDSLNKLQKAAVAAP